MGIFKVYLHLKRLCVVYRHKCVKYGLYRHIEGLVIVWDISDYAIQYIMVSDCIMDI